MRSEEIAEKKPGRLAKAALAVRSHKWTLEQLQDLFFVIGMASVFLGCWLTVHIGVSFTVCGALLLFLAYKASSGVNKE